MSDFEPKPFGKYFLTEKIAMGGMAEIYKAKTFGVDGFEKQLAIKKILPHYSADKEFVEMLTDEAKLVVHLSHTNIVQIYDLGTVGDDYYISMEFINGVNLREVLNRAKENKIKIPLPLSLYIISEVSKGLDYAHSRKDEEGHPLEIVHRDISPQNILISYEGEIKIVDFGIAKAAMNVSHTMAGVLKGKITYMSPEQSEGRAIDNRTDIFSTGLLLYELITGERFFTGDSQFEILQKIRTTHITKELLKGKLPDIVVPVLAKALAYDPEDRYETAGDFQIDLTKLLYSQYLDFSPKQIASFMQELFAKDLAEKQKKQKELSSLSQKFVNPSLQSTSKKTHLDKKQSSIIEETQAQKLKANDAYSAVETQKPEDEIKPQDLTGEVIVSDKDELSLLTKHQKKKKTKSFILVILLLLASIITYGIYHLLKSEPTPISLGEIRIISNPDNAEIYLNGQKYNERTPAVITDLPLEEFYEVELKIEGFKNWKKSLFLESSEPYTLEAELPEISLGAINIKTTPPNAEVFLDEKKHFQLTPTQINNLDIGSSYQLRIIKEGYAPVIQNIQVRNSQPQLIDISLQKIESKPPEVIYGSIIVNSTPLGANISIDGDQILQTTPATIDKLIFPKAYEITVVKEGYESKTYRAEIKSATPINIDAKLEKKPTLSEITIESNVNQSEIFLDGRFVGFTPKTIKIKPGDIELKISKPGYILQKRDLQIKEEMVETIRFNLEEEVITQVPKDGKLTIVSNPSNASIYIAGSKKGQTPLTLDLTPDQWTIEVKKKGYKNKSLSTKVSSGKSSTLSFQLEKIELTPQPPVKDPNNNTNNQPLTGTGKLRINSNPNGAGVVINGKKAGLTPIILSDLSFSKSHEIIVEYPGYKNWIRSIKLDKKNTEITATLTKE